MPQGFSFSKKPDYEKRRAKGFRLPFFGTRQGGTCHGLRRLFQRTKWLSQKSAGGCEALLETARRNTFLQPAIHPLFSRKALRHIKRRRAVLHAAAKIWHSLVGRRRQHAYGREQPLNTPRIPQRTQTPPRTVSRLQRYMRYIINDLRRRPVFPPHMGCPARAPHPPLFRQTRQLSGCFRPPMRRLRAEMDAIAHARDNSRPSDGCRACRHSGRLAHCGRCQIHASSTDRSLSAIRHFSALRKKPMPRFSMRGESIPDERGLCFSRDSAHFVRHQIGSDIKRIVFNRRTRRASRRPPSVAAAQRPNHVQDARTDGARSQPSSFPSVSVPFPFSYKCRNSTAQKVKSHSSAVSSA